MYEALYRKYRPRTFDDVVGQDYITETLKNQVRTGRLSHAYLFIGTRGTGKTTCARILAKAVNCDNPVDGNPCNCCPSCRGIEDGSVMDVVELDAASNNGVDDVRMLRDEAIFSPTTVRKRVYIIDEVHMLSKPAFNALLKILEEPPQHLMFILATTELNKVLPTILSRCQRHSFRRLDSETIAKRLGYVAREEGIELTPDAARLLGRLADGGMRDGLSLLDQCASSPLVDTDTVLNAMGLAGSYRTQALAERIVCRDTQFALEQYESLWQDGKEPSSMLNELAGFFRDGLLMRLAPSGGRDLVSGAYGRESMERIPASESQLLWILNTIEKYQSSMYGAANPRLIGELCMVELCAPSLVSARTTLSVEQPIIQKPAADEKTASVAEFLRDAPPPPEPAPVTAPVQPAEEKPPEPSVEPEFSPTEEKTAEKPAPVSEGPGSDEFWLKVLDDLRNKVIKGTYILMQDEGMVSAVLSGDELVLRVAPGFQGDQVKQPSVINQIRQSATRLAGRSIQIRLEEKKAGGSFDENKLDMLGKFSNVTIR